jgi:hypothetical protein
VENIKEELDVAGEWFFDREVGPHGTLYLIPPTTAAVAKGGPPDGDLQLVATVHKQVVSITGNSSHRVQHFSLRNVRIAHAEATFLDRPEMPSGGDWTIHRSGASTAAFVVSPLS